MRSRGERMAQLLGRDNGVGGTEGFDYSKLLTTFNNAATGDAAASA
jgi:hypothetical protein